MKIEHFLIALLSAATISALSLKGYKCSDHALLTGDPVAPKRMIRICGIKDYAEAPNYFNYRTASGIKGQQHEPQQLSSVILKSVPILTQFYETLKYPLNKDSNNIIEMYHLVQQKLNSIAEDASHMTRSVAEAAASMKNIFDNLVTQNGNTKTEENIDVNLHFEPSLEALLTKFLKPATVDVTTKQPVVVHTPEPTELSNESNSNENNTEERDNTEESKEDYDSWIRLHFGPATTMPMTRGETTENYSDESFYSKEQTNDGSSEERSLISQQ